MENGKKVRDAAFDNVKAAMLVLVAFGHVLDVYMRNGAFEYALMKWIYLFHMPVFAFVTGYFSKNADRARETALTRALLPYLLFQGCYVLAGRAMIRLGLARFSADIFNGSLLVPSSAFYYLLAVFFWKLLLKDLLRFRRPFALTVVLGAAVGLTAQTEFHVGLGAVFSLAPFFVLGVQCDERTVGALRRLPRWIFVAVLAAAGAVAWYTPYAMHSVRLTYAECGFSPVAGIGWRLLYYAVAVATGAAVVGLAPSRRRFATRIGEASILVYAASTFLSPHVYLLVAGPLRLASNRALNLAGMAAFSVAVAVVFSAPAFLRAYRALMARIERLLLPPRPAAGGSAETD